MKPAAPLWLALLPAFLRARIAHRAGLVKALSNTGWLFSDQVLRMGVGLVIGVWLARYLGPEHYGLWSFSVAFVALFATLSTLGLQGIVVRDIVREPSQAQEILGTGFTLQLFGGFVAFLLAIGGIAYLRPDDAMARQIVAILGFALVFKSADGVRYWFESQVQSKYVVWVQNGVFLAMAAAKAVLIVMGAPLIAFVWVAFADALLVALALAFVYARRGGRFHAWRVRWGRVKQLLNDSWPLILSGLAIMVYMRIDQVMLGHMLGDEAVGIYTAAVRISEVWYFIPAAIASSVFPAIIQSKNQNDAVYLRRLQKLYDLMVVLGIAVALPMTFMADWLIITLFGAGYAQAGTVLAVYIWAGVFVFLGVASGQWFLVENLQKYVFYRTILGAVINIILNVAMIPVYGVIGAAVATVISQAVASVFFNAVFSVTRPVFVMQCKSFTFTEIFRLR